MAILRIVTHEGLNIDYAIVFSLDPIKGYQPFDLQMAILSAYLCDERPIVTMGRVGFKKLVSLRLAHKQVNRNTNRNRPRK